MPTLSEIEAAVSTLGRAEQEHLLRFIETSLRETEENEKVPRKELLSKWQKESTGVVEEHGGTQSYLRTIRGRDEDGR